MSGNSFKEELARALYDIEEDKTIHWNKLEEKTKEKYRSRVAKLSTFFHIEYKLNSSSQRRR